MSALDEHLKRHRKRIIDRERRAFAELLAAYGEVERELQQQILVLQAKIKAARDAGEEISAAWFAAERRLDILIDQVKMQIERFGRRAAIITSREQRAAVELAVSQARETIDLITGNPAAIGSQLTPAAVENAVGMMGDGSPLIEYYRKKLAPAVADALRAEVVKAAAAGTPFAAIAQRLRSAGKITKQRALATARTEVNRVRRETTRQFFEDNADSGITGWEWVASKSLRTCPACLAMDGEIFEVSKPFPQHVNCRCTLIAVIDGVERPARTLGSDWLAEQPYEVQEKILGKDAAAAYAAGDVELSDFVGRRYSKEFGESVYTKSLSSILMNKR